MRAIFLTVWAIGCAIGCGDDAQSLSTPQECNPLGGVNCITPWPSSIYQVEDDTTVTGFRNAIPAGALPKNIDMIEIDPAPFNAMDGFSSAAPMIMAFKGGVDGSNLVHYSNMAASVTADSPTVVIDLSTGELVPHFAELDARTGNEPDSQALYIRPAKLLKGSTRYLVGIKKTLKARGGGELAVPPGFQALVDGTATSHERLKMMSEWSESLFTAFRMHGIERTDLVTAWDFVTASRASMQHDLQYAKESALAAIGTNGANLTFSVTTDVPVDAKIARRIDGEFDAPLFLTNGGSTAPSTRLVRDASGKPMATGTYRVRFTAIVPQCAIDSPTPVPLMIYGHGLLGTGEQAASGGTRIASAELCVVVVGTDMRGMASEDVPNVLLALNDMNNGPVIFDVLVQGMMNHIALVQIARGPMARDLFVKGTNPKVTIVDPEKFYYYGISQGGIMGATVCAIDPVIKRCVLQVGAINYSLLLERSLDWPTYRTTLIGAYPNPLDVSLILNLMQMQWDRTEPTAVADTMVAGGFPGTPAKEVLLQVAIGDDEVSNLGSDYMARTMGIPTLTPSPYVPWGTEGVAGPVSSGVVIYDFGVGNTIPPTNEPPPDNDVHSNVRNKGATMEMMKQFYETGEIVNTCTAPTGCDCAANGCGAQL